MIWATCATFAEHDREELRRALPEPGELTDEDRALLDWPTARSRKVRDRAGDPGDPQGRGGNLDVVAEANRYFAAQEPWALKKTDPARMGTVLYVTAETVRQVAILAQALTPQAARDCSISLPFQPRRATLPRSRGTRRLVAGTDLPKPEPVFPRFIDQDESQAAS